MRTSPAEKVSQRKEAAHQSWHNHHADLECSCTALTHNQPDNSCWYDCSSDIMYYVAQAAKAVGDLAHELRMHLRCAGPKTVRILSVGMDKVPTGPLLSADVVCFSMEVASQSLKAYIGCVDRLHPCSVMFMCSDFFWVPFGHHRLSAALLFTSFSRLGKQEKEERGGTQRESATRVRENDSF